MACSQKLHLLCVAILSAVSPLAHAKPAAIAKEFIYTSAPFPSAHASTLVQLRNGDLLAAWFGGSHENAPDVAIWGSRRAAGHWSAPFLLVREPNIACWNPVLFHSADGKLWLYYKFGPSARTWTGARLVSNDDGKTWSQPEHLPAGLLGPIKDKPLVLADGTIVSGTSVESYSSWAAWIDRSTDNGKTWQKIGPITVPSQSAPQQSPIDAKENVHGIIQPAVVSLGKKHLRLYARSTSDIARICVADSFDNGLTWTEAHPTDLPNPNSGIDAVGLRRTHRPHLKQQRLRPQPAQPGHQHRWRALQNLRHPRRPTRRVLHPAIIQDKDGELDMTYTWNRKRISFASMPLPPLPAAHRDAP